MAQAWVLGPPNSNFSLPDVDEEIKNILEEPSNFENTEFEIHYGQQLEQDKQAGPKDQLKSIASIRE